MWYLIAAWILFNFWLPFAIYTKRSEPQVTTCDGCNKQAKYIVYGQAHCQECFDEALEGQASVEVRLMDDAAGNPNQGK